MGIAVNVGFSVGKRSGVNAEIKPFQNVPARKVMASPVTMTVNAATSIASGRLWPVVSRSVTTPDQNIADTSHVTFSKCNLLLTSVESLYSYNVKRTNSIFSRSGNICCSFIHVGRYLEFYVNSGKVMLKVNGEYITLTPATISGSQFCYVDFGAVGTKRVDFIIDSASFLKRIYTEPTAAILPVKDGTPRCVVVGDSFIETSSDTLTSVPAYLSDYLGWEDVVAAGYSGTGFIKEVSGSSLNYRNRIDHDAIALNPDVIILCGSLNDVVAAYTKSQMLTAVSTLLTYIKNKLPKCVIFTTSPTWSHGPSTFTDLLMQHRDAIKEASAAHGVYFIDWLTLPLGREETAITGTLYEATSAGASSFKSNTFFGSRSTVKIGTNYAEIKTFSGSAPFTYTIDGTFINAHAVDSVITKVGPSILSGTGNTVTPSGFGICDTIIDGADNVHPATAGRQYFAGFLSRSIVEGLSL